MHGNVKARLPKLRPPGIATLAIIIATLVELSRLIPIDALRLTLAGTILLGRYFSIKNIVAYIVAIALTAVLDRAALSRRNTKHASSS